MSTNFNAERLFAEPCANCGHPADAHSGTCRYPMWDTEPGPRETEISIDGTDRECGCPEFKGIGYGIPDLYVLNAEVVPFDPTQDQSVVLTQNGPDIQEQSVIFTFEGSGEMLKITPNGFYVRGSKVLLDENEALTVYTAFKEWMDRVRTL